MRYIQAAVSNEDYESFDRFARINRLTWSELIDTAVKEFIDKRKEVKENPEPKRKKI